MHRDGRVAYWCPRPRPFLAVGLIKGAHPLYKKNTALIQNSSRGVSGGHYGPYNSFIWNLPENRQANIQGDFCFFSPPPPLIWKPSREKISCLEKVLTVSTPQPRYSWNPLRNFLLNLILDDLKFLEMFGLLSSSPICLGKRPNRGNKGSSKCL